MLVALSVRSELCRWSRRLVFAALRERLVASGGILQDCGGHSVIVIEMTHFEQ